MSYSASTINFDGSTNWLVAPAGAADSKVGIFSCFLRFKEVGTQSLAVGSDFNVVVDLIVTERFRVRLRDSVFTVLADFRSSVLSGTGSSYIHILASWDLATPENHIWINGIEDLDSQVSGPIDGSIDYQNALGIGAQTGGVAKVNGAISELYFNIEEFLDISAEANRLKFRDSLGCPVGLGNDGSIPTGTAPAYYFREGFPNEGNNAGSLGDATENGTFTETGAPCPPVLSDAPTITIEQGISVGPGTAVGY